MEVGTCLRFVDARDGVKKAATKGILYDGEGAFVVGTEVFRPRAFASVVGTVPVEVVDEP